MTKKTRKDTSPRQPRKKNPENMPGEVGESPPAPPLDLPLNKVQFTYIRAQMYKIGPEEIATDLNVPLARVKRQVELFRQEDEATPRQTPPEGMGQAARRPTALEQFQVVSQETGQTIPGVAVMTPQRSMKDDEDAGVSPFATAGLTEAQRSYIRDKMGHLPPEQIARDCNLPTYVVRQVIDSLNPAEVGRQQFYERHRNSLHKIDPSKPIR